MLFESYERRIPQILSALEKHGISSPEEAKSITEQAGLDVYRQVEQIQPICFGNAKWAYIIGAAIAIRRNCRKAADALSEIGVMSLEQYAATKAQTQKIAGIVRDMLAERGLELYDIKFQFDRSSCLQPLNSFCGHLLDNFLYKKAQNKDKQC